MTFDIIESIAVLSTDKSGFYTLELNKISYNGQPPKYDLRRWDRKTDTMRKGVTLSDDEITALYEILKGIMEK